MSVPSGNRMFLPSAAAFHCARGEHMRFSGLQNGQLCWLRHLAAFLKAINFIPEIDELVAVRKARRGPTLLDFEVQSIAKRTVKFIGIGGAKHHTEVLAVDPVALF